MIHERLMERFETLREKLFQCIEDTLKVDNYHKPLEGEFRIEYCFPNYFEREDDAIWNIHLYCYIIGPGRTHDWPGGTFGEALRKAEKDIYAWINEEYEWIESQSQSSNRKVRK